MTEDYDDDYYFEGIDDKKADNDFDNRTWEVVKTTADGFDIGARFTYRDIVFMTDMIPCFEGMVFRNIKTGRERMLRNKEYNAKKIMIQAIEELSGGKYEAFVYGLDTDRQSLDLLVERINKRRLSPDSHIYGLGFYAKMVTYYGEDPCR